MDTRAKQEIRKGTGRVWQGHTRPVAKRGQGCGWWQVSRWCQEALRSPCWGSHFYRICPIPASKLQEHWQATALAFLLMRQGITCFTSNSFSHCTARFSMPPNYLARMKHHKNHNKVIIYVNFWILLELKRLYVTRPRCLRHVILSLSLSLSYYYYFFPFHIFSG